MAENGEMLMRDGVSQAKRTSLVLRTAKVVCQTGEYVCLIRDVSETAISLHFWHKAPPEGRIILQLTNGETHPIERVWSGKSQAGYRFTQTISPEQFLHSETPYHHRPIRLEIAAQARLTDGQIISHVHLMDISCGGAKFESENPHLRDRIISFDALGLPQRLAQVRWQEDRQFGLQFQHPLTIRELANIAMRAQPFAEAGIMPIMIANDATDAA